MKRNKTTRKNIPFYWISHFCNTTPFKGKFSSPLIVTFEFLHPRHRDDYCETCCVNPDSKLALKAPQLKIKIFQNFLNSKRQSAMNFLTETRE